MGTFLKLCGFQTVQDILAIRGIKVDAIGFVLVPNRKRTVNLDLLPFLLEMVDQSVQTVGVCLNPSLEELDLFLEIASLSAIQLHGNESIETCRYLKEKYELNVIKRITAMDAPLEPYVQAYAPFVDAFLVDHASGGTGKRIDWTLLPKTLEACHLVERPLYVAGGITSENVGELLSIYYPDGIDCSSGIETDGKKDPEKIASLRERIDLYDT